MSAIDCIDHVHVGYFNKIPVYWILSKDTQRNKNTTFECLDTNNETQIDKTFIAIGGGGGEHPALIIDLVPMMHRFLGNMKYQRALNGTETNKDKLIIEKWNQVWGDRSDGIHYWTLDLNDWPLETWFDFKQFFNSKLPETFPKKVETNIYNTIGFLVLRVLPYRYIFSDHPDLIELCDLLNNIGVSWDNDDAPPNFATENVWEIPEFEAHYHGMIIPVFPQHGYGSILKPGTNNVQWGYGLHEWLIDNPEYRKH